MAISLSNHSVLSPLRPSSSLSSSNPKPSKALFLPHTTLRFPSPRRSHHKAQLHSPILGFPRTSSFAVAKTSTSRFAASSAGAEKESSPTAETFETGGFSLKTLIKLYKEAILYGDEQAVSDIEARIDIIGNNQDELVEKMSTLMAEIKSGKEKYVRLQADFDNFRKRSEKDRLSVRTDTQGEVIESLLPMVDNFERAKQQIKPETDKEKKIDASYQGIYKQFVEIMRSLRVAVVPTVGRPFDPSFIRDITDILESGWALGGKCWPLPSSKSFAARGHCARGVSRVQGRDNNSGISPWLLTWRSASKTSDGKSLFRAWQKGRLKSTCSIRDYHSCARVDEQWVFCSSSMECHSTSLRQAKMI